MEIWQEWWVWLVAGLVLAIIEMLLPTGYILLGFAAGAVGTGIMTNLGFAGVSLPKTLLLFGLLSGLSWVLLRLIFGRPAGEQARIITKDVNDNHPPSP